MQNFTLNNEKELLSLAATGNEAAFAQLFYAYHNKLGAYVFRFTQSREITEEIVQDVFLKIWLNRHTLSSIENFGSYIYVLSKNHTLNCLRSLAKERVRNKQIEKNYLENHPECIPEDSDNTNYALVDRAINALPPQQQKAYILSRRERMKYEEIASYMCISRETVKKYLQLATHFIIRYVREHNTTLLILLAIEICLSH